jgi:molybdate transport system ATP-binding protein
MSAKGIGIFLSNNSDKKHIISQIIGNVFLRNYVDLSASKGVLHSTITIERFIKEELYHDRFSIQTDENKGLSTMSSGQQKKALLSHLIAQQPDFIVLDDVFSNIDKAAQASIEPLLEQLGKQMLVIQLFFRKTDVLKCVDKVVWVDASNNISKVQDADDFRTLSTSDTSLKPQFQLPTGYNEQHNDIDPLVQFNDVSVGYGDKKVLKHINWTIKTGEFWQLSGPNGSGKSTILSLITGDNPRGYGKDLILFGRKKGSGETIWDIKRQIGYFTPAMLNEFKHDDSVEHMIISGLNDSVGLYTTPTDLQRHIARDWMKMLGKGYENKSFQHLSIGQQRMVMVARAMVKHPPLLILDEPTIELDDENTSLFIGMVNAIAKEEKMAILYVSHRDEPELKPNYIFELVPGKDGSVGVVK